jgi:hypothetical protein
MLTFNDQPVLSGVGSVSHEKMKQTVQQRYDDFDKKRRKHEALLADADDIKALEVLEQRLKDKSKDSKP